MGRAERAMEWGEGKLELKRKENENKVLGRERLENGARQRERGKRRGRNSERKLGSMILYDL